MSFIFESDVELDDALVEAMEADEGEVDFGELEESYSELVTTLGSLNESMLMSVASAQYQTLIESGDQEALTEGVKDTLKSWWKKLCELVSAGWNKVKSFFSRIFSRIYSMVVSDEKWFKEKETELKSVALIAPFKMSTYAAIANGKAITALKGAESAAVAYVKSGSVAEGTGLGLSEAVFKRMFGDKSEQKIDQSRFNAALGAAPGLITLGKNIKSMQKQVEIGEKASVAQLKEGDKAVNASKPDAKKAREEGKKAQQTLAKTKTAAAFMAKAVNKARAGTFAILRGGLSHSGAKAKKESVSFNFFGSAEA